MSGDSNAAFDGFEQDLVEALQPIRQGMLAQVLFQVLTTGWHEALARGAGTPVAAVAAELGLDTRRFRGLMRYLHNEGVVELRDDDTVRLSDLGQRLGQFRPWYELLVGGYGQTFRNLPDVLKVDGPYADREAEWVATGRVGGWRSGIRRRLATRGVITRTCGSAICSRARRTFLVETNTSSTGDATPGGRNAGVESSSKR